MKRLLFYLLLLALAVTAGFFLGYRKPAKEAKPPPSVSVVETNAVVKELPLHKGDPLVLRMETPRSPWKSVVIAPERLSTTKAPAIDVGLAYELVKIDPDIKPITVPLINWQIGGINLPEITLDAIGTPSRYGVGLSTPITDSVDLEAGISRRWDESTTERYIGVGFHIAF
jgi:hypothetical protein